MISIFYLTFTLFRAVEIFATHEAILNVKKSCKSANVKVLQSSGFLIGCLIVIATLYFILIP